MEKKDVRWQILQTRDRLSGEERQKCSDIVADKLWQWKSFREADCVLSYASFRSEVDTDRINKRILQEGRALYLPKTYPEEHRMVFYRVQQMEELVCGYQGIREPQGGPALFDANGEDVTGTIWMLMPGAAFDKDRNRIGYGGGYYDRYLAQYGENISCTCMLAFEMQQVEKIEADWCDIRPDRILTEGGK